MGETAYDSSMVQDFEAQEEAAGKANEIILELRAAILKGGLDDVRMLKLATKWTELGMLAKGEGYLNNISVAWRSTYPATFSRKTSQELLDRMVRLDNALGKHLDIKERFMAFNAAEDAMRALVYEYRSRLKERDGKQLINFDGQLRSWVAALNPDFYKTRGD